MVYDLVVVVLRWRCMNRPGKYWCKGGGGGCVVVGVTVMVCVCLRVVMAEWLCIW